MRSLCLLNSFVLSLIVSSTFAAEPAEQPWLNLLRPDSLVGWDYGDSTEGWSMKEGVLSCDGAVDSAQLVSGYSALDFELEFESKRGPGAQVALSLYGQFGGKKPLGVMLPAKCKIQRKFQDLTVTDENGKTETIRVIPNLQYTLGLVARGGDVDITKLRWREPVGEPLFNGKDLTGWYTPGKKTAWHAEEGMIVKRGGGGNYLRTEKEFGNFTLSLDYKMSKGNNSGIGIRTPRGGWPSSDGMELQLLDKPGIGFGTNMSIYRNIPPLAAEHKSEEWNHCVIKADGYMISAWINGQLVQHANTLFHPELKFRHLKGWIGFQDHGGIAEFKNINLLEAPEQKKIAQWTESKPSTGAELVLDRLMNPQAVAEHPKVKEQIIEVGPFNFLAKEPIIADLKGPGALVGLTAQDKDTKLAFYFDEETEPRFIETASGLHNKLPKLTDQKNPLVTYVPFSKRLKIVQLSGKGEERFLLEYVTFPAGVHVKTMGDPAETIPRGWRATIDYRHNHYKYGQHRNNDPQPRAGEQNKTIEPGSAVPLLALEGAGIVQWWKLHPKQIPLENDDLWLEITVDGESEPAIAAPARYLFAPVADGHKHNNFLFTNAGGLFTRLAMPYEKGITILAKNKGEKPLSGVGITASYLPIETTEAGEADITPLRLRAAFLTEKSSAVTVNGFGRVVGMVFDPAQGKPDSKQGKLVLDRTSLAGWKDGNFNLLRGYENTDAAEVRNIFSGHTSQLAWRYFLLAPPRFTNELVIHPDQPAKPKLVLYYLFQQ